MTKSRPFKIILTKRVTIFKSSCHLSSAYYVPSTLLLTLLHALSPVIIALLLDDTDVISIFYMKKLGYRENLIRKLESEPRPV